MTLAFHCEHYINGNCHSCQWLELPYAEQIQRKQSHLRQQLSTIDCSSLIWQPPILSPLTGFRNKAKMVVSGAVERPILGESKSTADLTNCSLYSPHFKPIFTVLKDFIGRAGLVPYHIHKQKGELKYILLTESRTEQTLMLRFVLRSEKKLPLMQRELPALMAKLPQLKVVTANIQPQHAAILEGEQEIFLTENQTLKEYFNQVPLYIRPQSFFQTNPIVAAQLYTTAQQWIVDLPIKKLWDLFCGVGGFGLHCASALQAKSKTPIALIGIEIAEKAIESATLSAQQLGLQKVKFQSLDSANFALTQQEQKPDLVIVNPPRRGIGQSLAQFLNQMQPHFLLYSSCNASSMAKDLVWLTNYQLKKIQLFDMFPHTSHYETLLLLELDT